MTILKQRNFWLIVLIAATTLTLLLMQKIQNPAQISLIPQELPVYGQVPDFHLTERSGRPVQRIDLKGKVWIANFIFTRCMGICPMMSAKMRTVQQRLKDRLDVQLVSFSVDPAYDSPEVLKKYGGHFSADPQKWWFLTGDKEQIFKLSAQHFRLSVNDIPEAEREAPDQTINHSSKFALVDREGKIRGYYDSDENSFPEKLIEDVLRL